MYRGKEIKRPISYTIMSYLVSLKKGAISWFWAFKRVLILDFLPLNRVRVWEPWRHTPILNWRESPPPGRRLYRSLLKRPLRDGWGLAFLQVMIAWWSVATWLSAGVKDSKGYLTVRITEHVSHLQFYFNKFFHLLCGWLQKSKTEDQRPKIEDWRPPKDLTPET